MSNGPSEDPQSAEKRRRRRIWTTTGLTLSAIAVLVTAGGAWWAWVFINEKLSPWASEQLSDTLDRPVNLGEVERVSLTGVRFGQSTMPPTEDDPDELVVDAISIRVNPLQLFTRTLSPRIIFENPVAYVEQNAQGEWIEFDFDEEDEDEDRDPFIQINPVIEIQNGEVTVVPYSTESETATSLTLETINGTVEVEKVDTTDFRDRESLVEAQEVSLDLSAQLVEAGSFEINGTLQQPDYGEAAPPELENALSANLAIQAQRLDLAALSPVVLSTLAPDLPLDILAGRLNGNVEVEIAPQEELELTGTARLVDGAIALEALATPFTDIDAQARFQGNRIALEDASADLGALSATAEGMISPRNGYDLTGSVAPATLGEVAAAFGFELPVETTGSLRAEDVTVTGALAQPVISGNIVSTDTVTIDRVQFANIATQLTYSRNAIEFADLTATPLAGGQLTGEGTYTFGEPARLALQLTGQNLPADAIAQAYGLAETVSIGPVALEADIAGPLSDLSGIVSWNAPGGTYPTRGTAEVAANTVQIRNAEIAGGTLSGTGTLRNRQFTADIVAQGLQLGVFNNSLEGVAASGDVQLTGRTDNFNLRGIRGSGDITAALPGGTLDSQVELANGVWEADVQTRNFPVGQFFPNASVSDLTANALLTGSVDDFSLAAISGSGSGTAAIAGGTVTSDFTLANGTFQADGRGENLQLRQLSRDLQGVGDLTFQLAGNINNFALANLRGQAEVSLSEGLATAAAINPALARTRSPLTASLVWDGRQLQVNSLETAGLSARGTVTPQLAGRGISGIANIDLDITARDYALSSLPLTLPPVLGLEGEADFQGRLTGTPRNLDLAGNLALTDLALNDLVFEPLLAGDVNYSTAEGLAVNLLGQQDEITVNYDPQPRQLDLVVRAGEAVAIADTEGDLLQAQLYNFPISVLNIPPANTRYGSLRGLVDFATATVNLNTLNTVGQVDVRNLGIGFYSVDRLFGGFAYADGVARLTEGQIIMADHNSQGEAIATRRYDLSGRYRFGLTPELVANLSTDEGQLRDVFEVLKIQELADFRRGFTPNEGFIPASQEEAEAILATTPAGNPNGTLLSQLRRLSEIIELQIQEEIQADQSALPPLSELEGSFQGEVTLMATIPDNIEADFEITGQSWQWGPDLSADAVLAQGTYDNGLITLAPLQFSSGEEAEASFLSFVGDFSIDPEDQENRLMTIRAVNVPVDDLEDLANLPFDLDGNLNAVATLQGKLTNPDLEGELQIDDGALNGTPIDDAMATFAYENARAALDAELLLIGSDDPLTLSARVPYQFGFVEVEPANTSYSLRANVEDEGFALLNLFTRQIAWESGEGELILNLEGDLADGFTPSKFDGFILLDGATISSRTLPVPMTNVTGQVRLVRDGFLIVVDRLTGQFSEGQLYAQGAFPLVLPLENLEAIDADIEVEQEPNIPTEAVPADEDAEVSPDEDVESAPVLEDEIADQPRRRLMPLTLELDNIDLALKGLYAGEVNGLMELGGSLAFGPVLSGEVTLTDGTITIPEGGETAAATPASVEDAESGLLPPFRFEDMRILLGRDINIVQGAFLNVAARGGLRLDGTLDTLRPVGTIQLPSGRIGLFSVALRLAGNNDRAEFRGNFNPILDVTLQTALPDVSSFDADIDLTTSPFPENEVLDSSIRNIGLTQQGNRLVRITARYTGPASELSDLTTDSRNLQLSSSPPRSDQEIISLLSGNVITALDTLGGGDQALAGLGTFLGSALLGRVRDFLGDTVPISEFRIFQVREGTGGVNDSPEIGGEIGFDVTSNISVSVLKVLTSDTPFQFNTRYRLSDQFTIRGTTSYEDFSDRTGVLLEYETRF